MKSYLIILFACHTSLLYAQSPSAPSTIKVFIDCSNGGDCYSEYVRQEISLVDFVRDRLDADIHVVVTAVCNSVGCFQYSLEFIGRNQFDPMHDTIQYTVPPGSIDNDKRELFTRKIKAGLIRFLNKTQQADNFTIEFKKQEGTPQKQTEKDPWNFWVFQLSANGNMNGNQNYFSGGGYFNVSADKETPEQKTNLYVSTSQEIQKYRDDGITYSYDYHNYYIGLNHYRKLTNHWGVGVELNGRNSLFGNYKYQLGGSGNVEFSIFPYKEFNTKRWVCVYSLGPVYNNYYDTTIYLKLNELNLSHNFGSIVSYIQPWGSINVGAFWSNYLSDFQKNKLSLNGALQFRLVKGLNFTIWGNYNFVHDQINIRKGDVDLSQLLVRNKELLSSYDYNMGIGISYRFGSKFNNALNPVFRGLNYSINM